MEGKITIKYIKKNEDSIRIFGEQFVKNNKEKLKIEIDGEIRELREYFINLKIRNKIIKINIIGIETVINLSYMFYGCSSLLSLPDISKWNISKVNDISSMFCGCSSLSSLPDISKWNISNIKNISYIFCGCSSLLSLPDISKWNISNIKNINNIFCGCSSLLSLPDISK